MKKRNDSFPFMSDKEVALYWEAVALPEEERSAEHKTAVQQARNEADLLTLWELMEKLRDGCCVSDKLSQRLYRLYEMTDAEGLTA